MRLILIAFLFILSSCATSIPLKKISYEKPQMLEITTLPGNYNLEHFYTKSLVKVYESVKEGDAQKEKLTEDKVEEAFFKLNRTALDVDTGQKIQYKHWVSHLKGEIDLTSMGFPPQGRALYSIVNKDAKVLAVKDVPMETIFYVPRIPLPEKPVKAGDSWTFEKQWRSLKTGWPFVVKLNVTLKDWYSCGGLNCAHIVYQGKVLLPESNPISSGSLKSDLSGEFIYAPVGDQFLWSASKNEEVFVNKGKRVLVNSCVTSYQVQPDKTAKSFKPKFLKFCS
jgi:hypothetical protein